MSDGQLVQFRGFPGIGNDELVRYFTLTPADVAFVAARRGRGPSERLGLAVQLCTLPWLGFVPDDVRSAPPVAVARIAARLDVDPGALAGYGGRDQTRTDHLRLVAEHLGWSPAPSGGSALKELEGFLLSRAMEHAGATNLGLTRMAEACSVPYDVLAWTQEWYVREETLRAANTVIVNHHHRLDLAGVFGGGTMSSSDGQRFPVRGKSLTARAMNIHFADQGLSTYTHVSDQHSTYGTKVLVPTAREAATDLPIREHATDTHGVTLINFALFDLVGKALTPRIRDLGKITLCRDGTRRAVTRR